MVSVIIIMSSLCTRVRGMGIWGKLGHPILCMMLPCCSDRDVRGRNICYKLLHCICAVVLRIIVER